MTKNEASFSSDTEFRSNTDPVDTTCARIFFRTDTAEMNICCKSGLQTCQGTNSPSLRKKLTDMPGKSFEAKTRLKEKCHCKRCTSLQEDVSAQICSFHIFRWRESWNGYIQQWRFYMTIVCMCSNSHHCFHSPSLDSNRFNTECEFLGKRLGSRVFDHDLCSRPNINHAA